MHYLHHSLQFLPVHILLFAELENSNIELNDISTSLISAHFLLTWSWENSYWSGKDITLCFHSKACLSLCHLFSSEACFFQHCWPSTSRLCLRDFSTSCLCCSHFSRALYCMLHFQLYVTQIKVLMNQDTDYHIYSCIYSCDVGKSVEGSG